MGSANGAKTQQIISFLGLVVAFILVSYVVRKYQTDIQFLLVHGALLGRVLFIFLTALFVIFIIPLDIVFLIPVGVSLWGPIATACMSILGWTMGALVAFGIAKKWGLPAVALIVGENRVDALRSRIPTKNLFWSVMLLRMLVPVDLLSYALGIFSDMPWGSYVLATLIGVAPFGFFFAFAGTLPPWYQIGAFLGAFVLVTVVLTKYQKTRAVQP